MPALIPEPRPDKEQPPGRSGRPGWAWVEGSADTGPTPEWVRPGIEPDGPAEGGLPAGLDYQALLDGLAASWLLTNSPEDQDAEFAEWCAASGEGRLEPCDPAQFAAAAVEHMDPGPAQAGWLEVAAADVARLDEKALAGIAIAARRQASRGAAVELAAVAQIAARAAAADRKIGVEADGRPTRVCRDAVAHVEMALRLTHYGAEARADLAVMLPLRLPATGAALAAGRIDAYRAQLIAEITSVLPEDLARRVEAQILPRANQLTPPKLREKLHLAVIAADPEGAEQRRENAEQHAEMRLYADDDQTATLMLTRQPQVEAAASFARVTALAKARMAAGMPGTLNFHRSQVALGLLLGTLPPIPPAEGAPPDQPPPDDPGPDPDNEPVPGPATARARRRRARRRRQPQRPGAR